MIIQVSVGSSCHLKGSEQLVHQFRTAVEANGLGDEITLAGSFCTGNCNRIGVTVMIDDVTYVGITPDMFEDFFAKHVLQPLKKGGESQYGLSNTEKVKL